MNNRHASRSPGRAITSLGMLIILASLRFQLHAQLRFGPPQIQQDAVRLSLIGNSNQFHRIDASSNLFEWNALDIVFTTNGLAQLLDARGDGVVSRFYRATQVSPQLGVTAVSRTSGSPGDRVEIEGQFFEGAQPKENSVRIGGVDAIVVESSRTRLVVQIPAGAQTGPITVATELGEAVAVELFTVTTETKGAFVPPLGLSARQYLVMNYYGRSRVITEHDDSVDFAVSLPEDTPFFTMAAPTIAGDQRFFFAVTISNAPSLKIDATSTAQALIFRNSLFLTTDSARAEKILALINAEPKVAAFAQTLEAVYKRRVDPLADPEFVDSYRQAVLAVARSSGGRALSGAISAAAAPSRTANQHAVDLGFVDIVDREDTSFLGSVLGPGNGTALGPLERKAVAGAGPSFPYVNPVDWVVVIQELNVSVAFPDGRRDFNRQSKTGKDEQGIPLTYPLKPGGLLEERAVSADLAASRLNPVKFLVGKLFDFLMPQVDKPAQASIQLPDRDAVYIVRAIGPRWSLPVSFPGTDLELPSAGEVERETAFLSFGDEFLHSRYNQAQAANVIAVVLDTVSAFVDVRNAIKKPELFWPKAMAEVLKKIPPGSLQEFGIALTELESWFFQEQASNLAQEGLEKLAEGGGFLSKVADKAFFYLDLLQSFGQVGERISGMLARTTPLETGFIVVGNPFGLEIVSVSPPLASPDLDLTVVIKGAQFDRQNPKDFVSFEGTSLIFDGAVIAAERLLENQQKLTIRLPANLTENVAGLYSMTVSAQGRFAETNITISFRPIVNQLLPSEGFAAAPDFLGERFPGTAVRLRGAGFNSSDTYLFARGTAGVPGTNVLGSPGDIFMNVPAGAQSGPIRIVHQPPRGDPLENHTPPFTVLGPPEIVDVEPKTARVGGTITFTLRNAGTDPVLVRAQFTGGEPLFGRIFGNTFRVALAQGATSGPVRILTPAGVAQTSFSFIVEPGLTTGNGTIQVGGSSPITLARALAIAAGAPVEPDDEDVRREPNGTTRSLDPPYEEGDFITDLGPNAVPRFPVGKEYRDTIRISGDVSGDGMMTANEDTISGFSSDGIRGTVTVTGNQNTITGVTFRNSAGHGIVLLGNNNTINNRFETNAGDGVRIEGGKFNSVKINRARGNGGNGVTLTAGASFNEVQIGSGILDSATQKAIPDSGNKGHGIALLGDAVGNVFTGFNPSLIGNSGDGIYLSGPGVVSNSFRFAQVSGNGGNGATIAGGATGNSLGTIGTEAIVTDQNGGSGVVLRGSKRSFISLYARSNAMHGLLISGVRDDAAPGEIRISAIDNNKKSGIRIEKATSGILVTGSNVRTNFTGMEMEGPDTTNNTITLVFQDSTSHGVTVTNAHHNQLQLNVSRSGGNGIIMSGASNNLLRVDQASLSVGPGLLLTDGASANRVYSENFAPVRFNEMGIVLERGAFGNRFEGVNIVSNRQHGILLQGEGVRFSRFLDVEVISSGADGIRIQDKAQDVLFGSDPDVDSVDALGVMARDNKAAGIRVTGEGTRNISIVNSTSFSSFFYASKQAAGIVVEDGAEDVRIERSSISQNQDGIVIKNAAKVFLEGNLIGSNLRRGVAVENSPQVFVGGEQTVSSNQINFQPVGVEIIGGVTTNGVVSFNAIQSNGAGVVLSNGASHVIVRNNDFSQNDQGLRLSGASKNRVFRNSMHHNEIAAAHLTDASQGNSFLQNSIFQNPVGVVVDGLLTTENTLSGNSITEHAGKGISLVNNGNQLITPPLLTNVTDDAISGVANAPDGSRIEIFQDPADEGKTFVATTRVANGRFRALWDLFALSAPWLPLSATVTDPEGNTSEFGYTADPAVFLPRFQIAFASTRDGNSEIYLMGLFDSRSMRMTVNPAEDSQPVLSSDGLRLLFVSSRSGSKAIYSLPSGTPGGQPAALINSGRGDYDPVLSSDGAKVAFVSERDGNAEIYLANATDGSGLTRITQNSAVDRSPSFSPDGRKICFASNRTGNYEIFVINVDGTSPQQLTQHNGSDTEPAWSPNGTEIAFVSNRDGNPEIYSIRPDGTGLIRRTSHSSVDQNPSWLAYHNWLVFSSDRDSGFEIYRLEPGGMIPKRITTSSGDSFEPSVAWR